MASSTIFIDINKWIINIYNSFIDINKWIIDIYNSFIDINKWIIDIDKYGWRWAVYWYQ